MKTDNYLYKAGRVFIFMAWFNIFVSAIIIALMLNIDKDMFGSDILFRQYLIIVSIAVPSSILSFFVGSALKRLKTWAKAPSLLLSVLAFISPPLGTVFALFAFYYLYKGWPEFNTAN